MNKNYYMLYHRGERGMKNGVIHLDAAPSVVEFLKDLARAQWTYCGQPQKDSWSELMEALDLDENDYAVEKCTYMVLPYGLVDRMIVERYSDSIKTWAQSEYGVDITFSHDRIMLGPFEHTIYGSTAVSNEVGSLIRNMYKVIGVEYAPVPN